MSKNPVLAVRKVMFQYPLIMACATFKYRVQIISNFQLSWCAVGAVNPRYQYLKVGRKSYRESRPFLSEELKPVEKSSCRENEKSVKTMKKRFGIDKTSLDLLSSQTSLARARCIKGMLTADNNK